MRLNRFKRAILTLLVLCAASPSIHPQATDAPAVRKPWAEVAAPTFVSIGAKAGDPGRIAVVFSLVTGPDGADKASVEMLDAKGNVLESRLVGKSRNEMRTVEFAPAVSGTYQFRITALRNDGGGPKASETRAYNFSLPLAVPVFKVLNLGGGSIAVRWDPVAEAERYELQYQDLQTGQRQVVTSAARTDVRIAGLAPGRKYGFSVTALRGRDRAVSAVIDKTVRAEAEREWTFTWFGQSSKAELNTIRIIDADDLRFQLTSCSTLPDGQIDQKGGKFTAFHDGISYY